MRSGHALTVRTHALPELTDDANTPFWDRAWISTELHSALYDSADPDSRLYALVDPVVRAKVRGIDDMDLCDLPSVSLIDGDASEELDPVAPRLVDITSGADHADSPPPSQFLRALIKTYWGTRAGIFLSSPLSLEELKKHLRHFTRIRTHRDEWMYFRFWEPHALTHYLCGQRDEAEATVPWFLSASGDIAVYRLLAESDDGHLIIEMRHSENTQTPRSQMRIGISADGWGLLEGYAEIQFYTGLVQTLIDSGLTDDTPEQVDGLVRYNLGKNGNYGLTAPQDIEALNRVAAKFGRDFHENPPFRAVFAEHGGTPAVLGKYMRLWAA